MPTECSGQGEFSQFMPYHVFGHEYRDKFVTVMNGKGVAYEFRRYGRPSCPGFDYPLLAGAIHFLDSFHQSWI